MDSSSRRGNNDGVSQQPREVDNKRLAARELVDVLLEISTLLNTHLTRQQLSYCLSLIENGVNPEALANVIKELRKQYPEPLPAYETEGP